MWTELIFVVPEDDAKALCEFARERLGLAQIDEDWCTSKRVSDNATLDYAPAPPPPDRKENW